MPIAEGNGLRFDYESFGPQDAPAILLIQGLGMPAAMWPEVFVETLVAEGFRVVTFDNRDCGGSSRLADAGVPDIPRSMTRALLRRPGTAPYNLTDMSEDTRVVLDAAGVERAHVVGVSMGGMIAQVFAAQYPQRVRTLTSVMSTTGNPRPGIALGKARALRALLKRPPANPTIEQAVDHLLFVFSVIGSPGFQQHAAHEQQVVDRLVDGRVVRRALQQRAQCPRLAERDARPWIARRGHDRRQGPDPLRILRGEDLGDHAAHRDAGHVRTLDAGRIEDDPRVLRHVGEVVRRRDRSAQQRARHRAGNVRHAGIRQA